MPRRMVQMVSTAGRMDQKGLPLKLGGAAAMSEVLTHFKPGEIIGLVAVLGGLMIPITAIVGGFWYRGRITALKHEMVSRGMTPDEIQAVLVAGTRPAHSGHRRHACRC